MIQVGKEYRDDKGLFRVDDNFVVHRLIPNVSGPREKSRHWIALEGSCTNCYPFHYPEKERPIPESFDEDVPKTAYMCNEHFKQMLTVYMIACEAARISKEEQ